MEKITAVSKAVGNIGGDPQNPTRNTHTREEERTEDREMGQVALTWQGLCYSSYQIWKYFFLCSWHAFYKL